LAKFIPDHEPRAIVHGKQLGNSLNFNDTGFEQEKKRDYKKMDSPLYKNLHDAHGDGIEFPLEAYWLRI